MQYLVLDVPRLIHVETDVSIRRLDVFPELIYLLNEVDFYLLFKVPNDGFFMERLRLIGLRYKITSVRD